MRSARRWRRVAPARVVWIIYLCLGALATVAYAFGGALAPAPNAVDDITGIAVGIGAVVALFAGPRWHHARPARPWNLLGIAAAVFLVGLLVRPWATMQSGPA